MLQRGTSPNRRVSRQSINALGFLTMLLACTSPAYASCGFGKQPGYSDIWAVRYARTSCFGKCPDYEVLFSNLGLYYVGRRWVQMTGTYEAETPTNDEFTRGAIPKSLRLAIGVLERHTFFTLSVKPQLVTDVPHLIIAVERCDVTTKLDIPDFGQRRDIAELFKELDAVAEGVHWKKTSDSDDSPLTLYASIYP